MAMGRATWATAQPPRDHWKAARWAVRWRPLESRAMGRTTWAAAQPPGDHWAARWAVDGKLTMCRATGEYTCAPCDISGEAAIEHPPRLPTVRSDPNNRPYAFIKQIPHGLVVRIHGFHPCGQGSIYIRTIMALFGTSIPVGELDFLFHFCLVA